MSKRFLAVAATACSIMLVSSLFAEVPERIRELPMFKVAPIIDGDRFSVADEWAGADERECSPSQVLREGSEFGWRDVELQRGEISANQLNQSEGEDAAEALTDADIFGMIWTGWDADALYYVAEVADNVHDVENSVATAWWERDSISLYLDLLNEDTGGDITGEYVNLNIINYTAAPMNSSETTITMTRTVQASRTFEQEQDIIEGLEYGYKARGDEYGGTGDADYSQEGKIPWEVMIRGGNLPGAPDVGSEMGYSWIILDPDGDEAYGGQILCEGWASEAANYATWVFTTNHVGPTEGTAVESDSWARIKATFN